MQQHRCGESVSVGLAGHRHSVKAAWRACDPPILVALPGKSKNTRNLYSHTALSRIKFSLQYYCRVMPTQARSNRTSAYRGKAPTNPWLFTKKTVWMQRATDAIRAGAKWSIQGSTALDKVPFLVAKFSDRYPTNLTSRADRAARQRWETVQRWIGYLDETSGLVHWALFVWPGKDFDPSSDAWRDPIKDRFRHTGYEVVRITKQGAKAPVLTWRYQKDQFERLHDEIVQIIRLRQDARLVQMIHTLHRSPGFAGVRTQVKKLWDITRAEWKRTRAKAEEMPEIPKNIGYVRRLPDVGAMWSELMQTHSKGRIDGNQPAQTRSRKTRRDSLLVLPSVGSAPEKP